MRRGSLFWGFVLVIIGVILLLDNLGLLGSINVWNLLWPSFLIAFGIWILFGTLFRRAPATQHTSIPLEGAQKASIRIGHGAGRLDVHAGVGTGILVEGDFAGGLDYQSKREGDELDVKLRVPEDVFPFHWPSGYMLDWTLSLAGEIPLTLEFDTGAGEARLDLHDLKVTEFILHSGASSTTIDLPASAGFTRVSIEAGAASVSIRVPPEVAARIHSGGGLSSIDVNSQRFPSIGPNLYQSPDYDTAANRVEMDVSMGVGSVKIT